MTYLFVFPAWALITLAIYVLATIGVTAEWGASRLTGSQKFLRKRIDGGWKQ